MAFKHWLAASILLLSSSLSAQEIKAQALKEMPISPAELANICKLLPKCKQESGQLFKRKSPEEYYFIDDTPQLARLTKSATYQLKQRWDFSNYIHDSDITEVMGETSLSVHPALYPLSKEKWAVALVKGGSDWFPGGAATEEKADFLQLNDDGSYQVALKDIPFYYSLLTKACSGEEESKTSPHCYDDKMRILKITYQNIGKPYYQWNLKYVLTDWPAHVPQSQATVQEEKEERVPFESLNKR